MNKIIKRFKYVKVLIDITYSMFYGIFILFILKKLPDQLFELDFTKFALVYLIFILILSILNYIIYFTSIIWHEIGHLIFGLKAKLTFVSFNILSYTIRKENDKLKIKKEASIPEIAGYCNMTTIENKNYTKNSIKLYFMGGIIFNIIFVIISIILLIFTNNIYLRLIYILNIGVNIYLALYNSVPTITKSGANTDTLQIIYYLDDNEYINTISKFHTLQSLLSKGVELKDIDSKLFSKPQKFKNNSDVLNALIYVDYLSSKEQYNEAIEYIKKIMEKAKEFLSKQHLITLKLQLINCIFYSSNDLKQIENIWDKDIKKYLDLMGKVSPIYIGFNYMYATLIEKNESNSKKYLNQFKQLNKKNYNKHDIGEVEKIIKDVNNKIKNCKE